MINNLLKEIDKEKSLIILGIFLVLTLTYVSGNLIFDEKTSKGLVGHWTLDYEDYNPTTKRVTDKSPYENHGTNNGATLTSDRMGKLDGAMYLGGDSDWVQFGGDIGINGEMTLAFWFKTPNKNTNDYLFDNRDPGSWWFIKDYTGGSCGDVSGELCFEGRLMALDSDWNTNEWVHVVVTDNTSTAKMYIDGELVDTGTGEVTTMSTNLRLGTRYSNTGYFDGSFSDVRVYDRALSAEEIQSLYETYDLSSASPSTNGGLVGHWQLDEESYNSNTNKVTDKTPYSNDGTNYGATFTTDRQGKTNGAMGFDGLTYRIRMDSDDSLSPGTGDFTLSAWAKTDNTITNDRIFCNHHLKWELWSGGSGEARSSIGNTADRIISYGPNIEDGEWHHILATYDRDVNMTLYVDGELADQDDISSYSAVDLDSDTVTIGSYAGGTSYVWNGSIDDVRMYKRVLSENEIQKLADSYKSKASAGSLKKGLVLDMPLTSKYMKSSSILTDKTPYSNDGTNNGASIGEDNTSFYINDYINLGDDYSLNNISDEVTVAGWIYPFSSYGYNFIFSNDRDCCGDYKGYSIRLSGLTPQFKIWDSSENAHALTDDDVNVKEWVHLAGTYDGSTQRIYVNGEEGDSSSSWSGNIGTPASYSSTIGALASHRGTLGLNGSLSNVRVYNRALSSDEIKLLFDKGRY